MQSTSSPTGTALNEDLLQPHRCSSIPIHLERPHLAPTTINLRLAAVRRVPYEAADPGLLSPALRMRRTGSHLSICAHSSPASYEVTRFPRCSFAGFQSSP